MEAVFLARFAPYVNNTRRAMHRYRAIYAPPPRRWTFMGYGVNREHEHYFNVGRR
jgi:hypothetical protein